MSIREVHPVHMWFYSLAHPPTQCTHICDCDVTSLRLSSFGRSSRARLREQRNPQARSLSQALFRHFFCIRKNVPYYRSGSVESSQFAPPPFSHTCIPKVTTPALSVTLVPRSKRGGIFTYEYMVKTPPPLSGVPDGSPPPSASREHFSQI